jgi:hypothetical protein
MGFDVGRWAHGGWTIGATPGQLVDFSTDVGMYYYASSISIDPIAATPEPASLLLLGTGVIVAGARRRLKLF